MTVLEIFKSIDREQLANKIIELHPHQFAKNKNMNINKKNVLDILDIFYKDILSITPYTVKDKEFQDYLDFVMVITNYYDDNEYDGVNVFDLDKNSFELDKLNINKCDKFFCVDAIHLNQLKKNYKCLDLSFEEIKNIEDFENNTIISYGIDFLTRKIVLSLLVSQPCIDNYGLYTVAAELFWEMTFYGLIEENIQKESHKLDDSIKEIEDGNIKTISLDDLKDLCDDEDDEDDDNDDNDDNDDEMSTNSYVTSKEDINFSIAFSNKVNEYNYEIKNNMLKQIYNWVQKEDI